MQGECCSEVGEYPANTDPTGIEMLSGKRWAPGWDVQRLIRQTTPFYSPAVDADDNMTVWNHIGKKYTTEKLQNATRKLLMPKRTGTFCLSRNGASTGSTASFNSTTRKRRKNVMAATRAEITRGSCHYQTLEKGGVGKEESSPTGSCSL